MELTCPNCRASIPPPRDPSARDVACPACGRNVALDELPTMVTARPAEPVANPNVLPASCRQFPAAPPPAQRRLPGYHLVKLIARGGMGEVHEAIQESLNRRVAVKILPPELATDANFVRRFEREAGALAQLSHPNIVAIYDRGCEDGCNYFVLEYVEGSDGGPAATFFWFRSKAVFSWTSSHSCQESARHRTANAGLR
jgi:hypothetical protein